jgi:hypothetical protein
MTDRLMVVWLALCAFALGAVLGFTIFTLANLLDRLNSLPFCRQV